MRQRLLAQWQTDLTNQVFNALTDFYCDPEKLNKAALENSLADIFAQFPDKPETKEQYKLFLDSVNKKLKQFDSHLELGFEPEFIAERQETEIVRSAHSARFDLRYAPPSKEWLHDRVQWESQPENNYGLVSQPPANIPDDVGYLKINHLIDPSSGENESEEYQLGPNAKKAVTAALQKLAGKKAIILDLRNSKQGGDPDMVQYIVSHFMQQHRGLNIGTGIDTRTNETIAYKVLPTPCDLSNIPVYILTDHTTHSAREAIAYHLKHFNEYVHPGESPVTIIGEKTVGGAHPTYSFPLVDSEGEINKELIAWIPCEKGINAFTGKDWEGVGVVPDIKVKAGEDALAIALDIHQSTTQLTLETEIKKIENNLQPGRQISGVPAKDILTRMQELHVPSASVTVIKGGVVEWSQDYDGVSGTSEDTTVAPVFQAGSISKTVNAVLAMKLLVQSGKIAIDEDLSPRLLEKMGIPNNTGKAITLAQLLSHTAGISKPGFGFLGYHSSGKDFPTTAQTLAGNPALRGLKSLAIDLETHNTNTNIAPVEVVSEPGKECAYSGGGTTIIQKLIEEEYCKPGSNETYASLAKTHIFDPLGMTQSSFEFKVPGTTGAEVQKGHHKNGDVIPGDWRMYPELGAAGLWTTSNDLAKFMIAMQDAYLGKPNSLLSTETARQMLTHQPDPGYELCLMSDDPSTKLEPNKLYIALDAQNQTLMYSVLTPEGIEVRNKPLLNYAGSIPDPLTTGAVASLDKTKVLEGTSKAGDTRYFPFSLGFAVHGEGDAIAFGHDGSTIGFQADFICFPNKGKGMGAIVMTNSDNGFRLTREIFSSLAQHYDYPERTTTFEDVVRLDDKILQRCAGEFVNSADKNVFFISKIVDGQLKISLPHFNGKEIEELTFVPLSSTKFFCTEHQFEVTFDLDYKSMTFGDGKVSKRNDMSFTDQKDEVNKVENNLLPPTQIVGSEIPGQNIFDRMQALNVPNVSVTVISEGKTWTREYDLATRSAHESLPSQPEVFQAASTSKTVNAVLAMKLLVETGKIEINENLTDRLKEMGIENNSGAPITLGQLLSHTAGIPSGLLPDYHPSDSIPTTEDVLKNSPLARIEHTPGEAFHYSNCGTTIVQKLIEDAYPGETYAALAQKHILGPLHMDHSTFERQSPAETKLNIQAGHVKTGDAVEGDWRVFPQLAAAGLWTTSNDLAIFAAAVQNAYLGKDTTLMSQETAKSMLTAQHNSDYGLGFHMEGAGDSVSFGHSGGSTGFKCDYIVFPHKGTGAIVMTNAENGMQLVDEIERGLAQIYAWPARGACEYKQPVKLEEQNAKQCSGRFVVNFNGNDIVFFPRVENGKLHLSIPYPDADSKERKDLLLTPISQKEFICVEPISFNVQFNADYSEMVIGGGLSTKRSNSPQTSEQALFGKTHAQTLAVPRPVPTTLNEDDKKDLISRK